MIIKKTVNGVDYEANLEGQLYLNGEMALQGLVVVHDPDKIGGRRRAFIAPETEGVRQGHVVICKAAFK